MKYLFFTGLLFFAAFGFSNEISVSWSSLHNIELDKENNIITKMSSSKNWNAWARSSNQFEKGGNAELIYKIDNLRANVVFGLSTFTESLTLKELNYGLNVDQSKGRIIVNGEEIAVTNLRIGDELKIFRKQSNKGEWFVIYKKNDEQIAKINASDANLNAYVMLKAPNSTFKGLTTVLSLREENENFNSGNPNGASIKLFPSGGTPPYKVSWKNGQKGSVLNGLFPGSYIASITDANNKQIEKRINIYAAIDWVNETNVISTSSSIKSLGEELIKGAYAENRILKNDSGELSFKASEGENKYALIGLSQFGEFHNAKNIEFGFAISGSRFMVLEKGEIKTSGDFLENQVFKISRKKSGNVLFMIDNKTVFTSEIISKKELVLTTLFQGDCVGFKDVKTSFWNRQPLIIDTKRFNNDAGIYTLKYKEATNTYKIGSSENVAIDFIQPEDEFTISFPNSKSHYGFKVIFNIKDREIVNLRGLVNYEKRWFEFDLEEEGYVQSEGNKLIFYPDSQTDYVADQLYLNLENGLVFSPDGDGNYDELSLVMKKEINVTQFIVYDLKGNVIYQTTDKHFNWNGQVKGTVLKNGTYNYALHVNQQIVKGQFLLQSN